MGVPTRSSRQANGRAWGAVIVGLLSVAAVPAAVAYTHYEDVDLLRAGWGVAPGFVLGIASLVLVRGARRRTQRTIGRVGGRGAARLGGLLGVLGVALAVAGAISLGVYEILNQLSY